MHSKRYATILSVTVKPQCCEHSLDRYVRYKTSTQCRMSGRDVGEDDLSSGLPLGYSRRYRLPAVHSPGCGVARDRYFQPLR
jgi:hypothetical protein